MKAMCISGGGFKIISLAGHAIAIDELEDIKCYAGVSSGALVAWALANNKREKLRELMKTFSAKDVFVNDPESLKGKIIAGWRLLRSKPSLFDQKPLYNLIRDIASEEDFLANRKSGKQLIVCAVEITTGKKQYVDLFNDDVTYEDACKWLMATSSIPAATEPVKIKGKWYNDGGIRDHVPTNFVLNYNRTKLTKIHTVLSRTKNYREPALKPKDFTVLNIAGKALNIATNEISKNDMILAYHSANKFSVNHRIWYAPEMRTSTYSIYEPERLTVLNSNNIEVYEAFQKGGV